MQARPCSGSGTFCCVFAIAVHALRNGQARAAKSPSANAVLNSLLAAGFLCTASEQRIRYTAAGMPKRIGHATHTEDGRTAELAEGSQIVRLDVVVDVVVWSGCVFLTTSSRHIIIIGLLYGWGFSVITVCVCVCRRRRPLAKCANKNVFVCVCFLFAPVFSTWQRPDVNYLNCGVLRNNCLVRLGESRDNIDRARTAFLTVAR